MRAVMDSDVTNEELTVETTAEQTTADAGLAGVVDCSQVGETSIVRVPCSEPNDEQSHTIAVIYVRPYTEETAVKWEALGILNGEEVFHEANYDLRRYAIEDAARTLAAEAAESSSRSDKNAARFILAYQQEIETAEGDHGPEGEPSEWPAFAGASEGEPEIEDAGIPLAGEGEIQPTDENPNTPQASEAAAELPPVELPQPPTPAERNAAARADFELRLSLATDELVQASIANKHSQEVAKDAKARLKAATDEIARLGERGPEVMPLFDGKKKTEAASEPTNTDTSSNTDHPQAPSAPAAYTSDAWRSRPTTELGLPPKLTDKLADNGIETIGALEDQRAAFKGLRGISGIGHVKADLIESAVLAWLDRNRDVGMVGG